MRFSLSHIEVSHEDERRSLTAVFNGDFIARQVKLLKIKQTSILGNHYHNYSELYYICQGRAVYTLVDVDTKEREEVTANQGDRLIIGARIAHKVSMSEGTMTVEATEQPYVSPEKNDVRYEID